MRLRPDPESDRGTTDMEIPTRAQNRLPIDPRHLVALRREHRRRRAAIRRYERYISEAAGHLTLQGFWRDLRRQDEEDSQRLTNRLRLETALGPEAEAVR